MRCTEAAPGVEAHADGEIAGLRALRLRRHLASCPDCAACAASTRAWRQQVADEVPVYRAPADLVAALEARYASPRTAGRRATASPARWQWVAAGAVGGIVATFAAWLTVHAALDYRAACDDAVEAVVAHVRATAAGDLVQVASSDHRTVKPWLSARLDYSPPVDDLRDQSFLLIGARLDTLDGQPVATLVYRYRYRQQVVDVFVRPSDETGVLPPATRTIRGFNVIPASGNGMRWLVVSDVTPRRSAPSRERSRRAERVADRDRDGRAREGGFPGDPARRRRSPHEKRLDAQRRSPPRG